MQKGDVPVTFADTNLLKRLTGYRPRTEVRDGIGAVIDWYKAWGPLKGA
jgi:UDP-glucuronate 4-epimerase